MPKAFKIYKTGDAGVLQFEDVKVGDPGPGEIRLRHTAIGLNYIDIYFRTGVYPAPELPFVPGFEAAGVIEAVGADVDDLALGDRVAYATAPIGAYAEERLLPAASAIPLPPEVDDRTAAAVMLKGMTAQYLLRQTQSVGNGDTLLIHAAAGATGLLMCQWAKHLGARVIGTVSSDEKAELVRSNGCEHPIVYTREDFVERVNALTDGRGVDIVYDSVGRDTFTRGFECLRLRGMMVLFGASSGAPDPIAPTVLQPKSQFLTRPSLFSYVPDRQSLLACAKDVFQVLANGAVRADINQERPLAEAADAHRDLESRRTTGATVLIP